jgi:hypothetical protein
MSALSLMRWAENYHLFILGSIAFAFAYFCRAAARLRPYPWVKLHLVGMGSSYIFMLIAFYIDNRKNLPFWKELPQTTYWLLPSAVGIPLIIHALRWHPLAQQSKL